MLRDSLLVVSMCTAVLLGLGGCTVAGVGKPTLSNTTSAEQTQRIFWDDVKAQKWNAVEGLLLANVTWRNGTRVLSRDEIVPYLQQLKLKEYLITNLVVKANSNDMTVIYDLQLTAATGGPTNLHAVAVWQQLPLPPPDATKKEKKQAQNAAPYLLTVEDLVGATP